jgi:hypothetical protein
MFRKFLSIETLFLIAIFLQHSKQEVTPSCSNYKVKEGDSAWGISQDYKANFDDMKKYNPNVNLENLLIGF